MFYCFEQATLHSVEHKLIPHFMYSLDVSFASETINVEGRLGEHIP